MLLLIDLQKAFDSINFDYILISLQLFLFGENFMGWIRTKFEGVTITNGNISQSFNVGMRCRQGDPISGYLFILAIEILVYLLKTSKVNGYKT